MHCITYILRKFENIFLQVEKLTAREKRGMFNVELQSDMQIISSKFKIMLQCTITFLQTSFVLLSMLFV